MCATVTMFPLDRVKCPVGTLVLHVRLGYVQVLEVLGDRRRVGWEEVLKDEPCSELEWLNGAQERIVRQRSCEVHVTEVVEVVGSWRKRTPGEVVPFDRERCSTDGPRAP